MTRLRARARRLSIGIWIGVILVALYVAYENYVPFMTQKGHVAGIVLVGQYTILFFVSGLWTCLFSMGGWFFGDRVAGLLSAQE